MPRDVSGNYTLPPGINPVVSDTLIDVDWANPTLADIATQLNNVLTRDGLLAILAPLRLINGTAAIPSLAFTSDTDTGIYRNATNSLSITTGGVQRLVVDSGGNVGIADDLVVAGNITAANIASGTYTPVGTPGINVTVVTPDVATYLRVGNTVTVAGLVELTITAGATGSLFTLTLPIASDFVVPGQLSGTFAGSAGNATNAGAIAAETVTNTATFYIMSNSAGSLTFHYHYTYRVI